MSINQHPPVFWINQDRRPDRRVAMERQLARHTGHNERIPAVDGKTVDYVDVQSYLNRMDPELRKRRTELHRFDPGAEVGCLRSHSHAVRAGMALDQYPFIILEDDVIIPNWNLLAKSPPADWEIALLCGRQVAYPRLIPEIPVKHDWERFGEQEWQSTAGYAVNSPAAATALLDAFAIEQIPADRAWRPALMALRAYMPLPTRVRFNRSSPSSISLRSARPPRVALNFTPFGALPEE